MEFAKKNRRHRNVKLEGTWKAELYPHSLQLYITPPTENISLQDFEELACERLKVLKAVETVGLKLVKGSDAYNDLLSKEFLKLRKDGGLKALVKKRVLSHGELDQEEFEDRRKDHLSHFILRLAYCKSEDMKRWFLSQELDLFRYRFSLESAESITNFLDANKLDYSPIDDEEKRLHLNDLAASCGPFSHIIPDKEKFYKVRFIEALELVRSRRVFLHHGDAYVPQSELVVIILTHYRTLLSHALAVTSRAVPNLEEDSRLVPILNTISCRYLGKDYASASQKNAGQITADMIEPLSRESFPLCMQHVHQALKQDHHLKHGGRMQYGLFLKGIGLDLKEALKFWRMEFCKGMDGDKFEKSYAYNVRHNYGQEGKRTDYTPFSCIKIISTNTPGPGDHHGCPFRHTDADMLRQKLQGLRVSKTGQDEVLDLVKRGHYQLACGKYFALSHAGRSGAETEETFSPNHPNQYFEESQRILNPDRKGVKSSGTPRTNHTATRLPPVKAEAPPPMDELDDDAFLAAAAQMEATAVDR